MITGSLLDFGTSFWSSPLATQLYPGLPSEKQFHPIGRFGIGFFSVFMCSNTVSVYSREFRASRNRWNVLIFEEGVRARGKFSVVDDPEFGGKLKGANTIVKLVLDKASLLRLVGLYADADLLALAPEAQREHIAEALIKQVRRMAFSLDVVVEISAFDESRNLISDTKFYTRSPEQIWSVLQEFSAYEPPKVQAKLIAPVQDNSGKFYGYCGINLAQYRAVSAKSTNGITAVDPPNEFYYGVLEHKVTSARRSDFLLAVPQEAMVRWVNDQIEKISKLELSPSLQMRALCSFSKILADTNSIFLCISSDGLLSLNELIDAILKHRTVTFPVRSHTWRGVEDLRIENPYLKNVSLQAADIRADTFTVFPLEFDNYYYIKGHSIQRNNLLSTITRALDAKGVKYQHVREVAVEIGTYVGEGSPHHDVHPGERVSCDVLRLVVK